jgi:excisionase family DNA binding protein
MVSQPLPAMSHELYSVEQVSDLLGLHVRTVRNYLRDGRLKGVRIGKQYRVSRADLEVFTGRPITPRDPVRRDRHIEVASVVQVDAISPDAAGRMGNMLMAAARGRDEGDQPLRIDTIYDEERGRLKVIVAGGLGTSVGLLKMISTLAEPAA